MPESGPGLIADRHDRKRLPVPGTLSRNRLHSGHESGRAEAAVNEIVLRHVHDAVFATDLQNRITFWADSAARLFGYTSEEAVGRPFAELLPFQITEGSDVNAMFTTLAQGATWRGEGTVQLRDGSTMWVESTVNPIVMGGVVVGSVSVSRDMSAAVAAQRKVEDQQRFLDAVLDLAGFLIIVLDTEGRIVRFNRACEQLTGYDFTDVVDRVFWDTLVLPAEAEAVRASMPHAAMSATGLPSTLELRLVTRSGAQRLIAWSITDLADETGRVSHFIGAGIDLTEERRAADALRGIEAIGRLLTKHGPTPVTLDAVVGRLSEQMGYPFLTLFLIEGQRLRLGGQRGYGRLPDYFLPDLGVVGRVLRTGLAAFVPDVSADPDYQTGSPDVRSEIAVPLRAEGRTFGILNIEATEASPLTENDLRLAQAVADRVSSALLLGREQQDLADRARLFAGLNEFARVANSMLRSERLWPELVGAIDELIPARLVMLITLDRETGGYVVRAVLGMDEAAVGAQVVQGEGFIGRAISNRALAFSDDHPRSEYPRALRRLAPPDALSIAAIPMVREGAVLGVIAICREASDRAFSELEQEVMNLIGAQTALAMANVHLLEEISELALHDALTGLFNRRHFDASLDHVVARWQRERDSARPLAAIMFDLDHFGRFNNEHGHQAGDEVLRAFAGILRARLRSSDLVARYGGEEFVAILENCTLAEAVERAGDVRRALEARVIEGPDGQHLRARVSAGCAVLDPAEPTKEALLRTADVGLFMAKRGGRNQVVAA